MVRRRQVRASLLLVPLLGGCIWPEFPDDLLDSGIAADARSLTDARTTMDTGTTTMDATVRDVPIAPMSDAMTARDTGPRDVGPDLPTGPQPGGFAACVAPPVSGFTVTRFAIGIANSPDLAFDGNGLLATGFNTLARYDGSAMMMSYGGMTAAQSVRAMRFLPDGTLAIGATPTAGQPGLRLVSAAGAVTEVPSMGNAELGTPLRPSGIAVSHAGRVYFSDVTGRAIWMYDPARPMVDGGPAPATLAIVFAPTDAGPALQPGALALTPDETKLYVGTPTGVYVLALTAAGDVTGEPMLYAPSVPSLLGLAFDRCGNLYASDRDHQQLLRIPAGGGAPFPIPLADGAVTLSPTGIAFGRGGTFATTSIYFTLLSAGTIYRVEVGETGAPATPAR